jgi:hypothetical protein
MKDEQIIQIILKAALKRIVSLNNQLESAHGDLFAQWILNMVEQDQDLGDIIINKRDGFMVSEAGYRNFDDPDVYITVRWLEFLTEHPVDGAEREPLVWIYPGIEQYQDLRSENLQEICTKPYHFIIDQEPTALCRSDWAKKQTTVSSSVSLERRKAGNTSADRLGVN